jgi:cell division septation protein DedD
MAYFEPMDPAHPGAVPYRRIKRRSHRGIAVVLALGVMAVSAGGLWIGYRLSAGRTPSGDIPLIHADTDPVKVKPTDPGGMEIPNRDRFVFNPTGNMPVERLLPAPEAPLPRPATVSTPMVPAPPPAAATATPAIPAPGQTPPASAAPAPTQAAPAPAQSSPAVTNPSKTQTAAIPSTGSAAGYRLQLGAVKTPEMAKSEWARIKREYGDLVGSLTVSTERADLGDRGVYYRIQVGPVADAAQAERVCAQLRQRGQGCILAKP